MSCYLFTNTLSQIEGVSQSVLSHLYFSHPDTSWHVMGTVLAADCPRCTIKVFYLPFALPSLNLTVVHGNPCISINGYQWHWTFRLGMCNGMKITIQETQFCKDQSIIHMHRCTQKLPILFLYYGKRKQNCLNVREPVILTSMLFASIRPGTKVLTG